MLQGSFQLTKDDFVAAQWLNWKRSLGTCKESAFYWLLAAIALSILMWATDPCADWWDYAFMILVLMSFFALFSAVSWPLTKLSAKRSWKESKKLWVEQHVTCTQEDIEFKSDHGFLRLAWNDFHRWATDDKVLVLYQSSSAMTVVPLRAFEGGAAEAIADWLNAAGVKGR